MNSVPVHVQVQEFCRLSARIEVQLMKREEKLSIILWVKGMR